jgi:amino acid transporter
MIAMVVFTFNILFLCVNIFLFWLRKKKKTSWGVFWNQVFAPFKEGEEG